MVKDVIFILLDDEENAEWKHGGAFGRAIGAMSLGEAQGEGVDGRVWRERGGGYARRICCRIGVYGVKVTIEGLELGPIDSVKQTYARKRL